jgi:hypothetical protein
MEGGVCTFLIRVDLTNSFRYPSFVPLLLTHFFPRLGIIFGLEKTENGAKKGSPIKWFEKERTRKNSWCHCESIIPSLLNPFVKRLI